MKVKYRLFELVKFYYKIGLKYEFCKREKLLKPAIYALINQAKNGTLREDECQLLQQGSQFFQVATINQQHRVVRNCCLIFQRSKKSLLYLNR